MQLEKDRVLPIIKAALKEDIGKGDITTSALVDSLATSKASIIAKEDCVVCGLEIAEWVMSQIDYSVRFKPNCKDGASVGCGMELAFIDGHTASILRAERTMLNFLTFLSGVATKTKRFVDIATPYGVKILDTRKTLPLLRYLEKYAVYTGGGTNHRMGLYDQVLIKDNHIFVSRKSATASREVSLKSMVEAARKRNQKGVKIEIEVTSIEQFNDALAGKPDIIMLDNVKPKDVKACMEIRKLANFRPLLEVSGGINIDTLEGYAKTRVDMISVGELTDTGSAVDMSLEIV